MIITSTTELARVNEAPSLQFIVGGFLARYPATTRRTYGYFLRNWFRWCEAHGIDPMYAQRAHIETFGRHLDEERGLMASTCAQYLKTVCGLYHFAHVDGYLAVDPSAHVRRPKVEFISTTNGLDKEEVAEVLRRAKMRGPIVNALMHMLILNGTRIGETLAADIEHLGQQGEIRTIFLPHRKGGKTGTLGLADPTYTAIVKAIDGRTSGPLFLGRNGQRMTQDSARRIVARLCKKAGIDKRITPHSCRHSFVTLALDAGVPVRDIMD